VQVGALLDDLRREGHDVQPNDGIGVFDLSITDVVHDSRQAAGNTLFCAIPGAITDGHDYVAEAAGLGAPVVLVERFVDHAVPQLLVPEVRRVMPHAAALVHGRPSERLNVVGVTGTNGKTTTTHMLAAILRTSGVAVEVIGTLSGAHTTPESTDLQRTLRAAADSGTTVVAAEVSSHALAQHRVDAVVFAVAAFTNLTPDHLDFHGDMTSYFEAKARLFDGRARHELINVDDQWGVRLAELRPDAVRLSVRDTTIEHADLDGSVFVWRGRRVRLPLAGDMNVANALMAAESARLFDLDDEQVVAGLESLPPVPGRMERVPAVPGAPTVIVDYSHTPDSIERALATVRSIVGASPVTIVFGCGGDRDRPKRPLMGRAAERADLVVVTSDNPRSEDPMAIIDDALAGMTRPDAAVVEPDRRMAIATAIERTPAAGVVLVAGKGHERTQTVGERVLPFDDMDVASEILEELDR